MSLTQGEFIFFSLCNATIGITVAGEGYVQPDLFHDRLEAVRQRFASSLTGKIQDTRSQLANLSGDTHSVVDAVAATYRLIHGICGIGAAVGFVVTGRSGDLDWKRIYAWVRLKKVEQNIRSRCTPLLVCIRIR